MDKLCLMVAFHKQYFNIETKDFMPIHVGKKNSNNELGITGDDTGDNISNKNKNFCELTALYWGWKNIDAEYYGLMHYRRYFIKPSLVRKLRLSIKSTRRRVKSIVNKHYRFNRNLTHTIKSQSIAYNEARKLHGYLEQELLQYDVFVPEAILFKDTLKEQFVQNHFEKDFDFLEQLIHRQYPNFTETFDEVFNGNILYAYNMFIMKKEYFINYVNWLFEVLFFMEQKIDISGYDAYQSRLFGFIAERLFTVYFYHLQKTYNVKFKELPIMFFEWN